MFARRSFRQSPSQLAVLLLALGTSAGCHASAKVASLMKSTALDCHGPLAEGEEARPECAKPAAAKEKEKDDDKAEAEGKVHLSDAVVARAKIQIAPASLETLRPTLAMPGEVVADPDRSARVSSPAAGRLEHVAFREGQSVKKGDVLAVVRVPELGKARAAWTASNAKAASARSAADRAQALADHGLAARQEAISARAEADALQAEARAAEDLLSAIGTGAGAGSMLALRAPLTGVVVSRDAVVGQPLTTDQTVASIADLAEAWFLARVYEKDLGRVSVGADTEVTLSAYPDEPFEGKVECVSEQIDPNARTYTARVRLDNHGDRLRIGLFGTASVATRESSHRAPAVVIPRSAVSDIDGKPVAFLKEGDAFERRDLVLGDGALGKVEILSGLHEGDRVVVDGAFTVKSAMLKSTFGDDD